jgi:antitoxin component of RelBE/YafQ-DinJ toxin-antitoxin module
MVENSQKSSISFEITQDLKNRLEKKAKIIGIQIQDLIKLLLARDVGLL